MMYEIEVAMFMSDGQAVHRKDIYDEPWIKGLEDAWEQSQRTVNSKNDSYDNAMAMGRSWPNKNGPLRLVGCRMIGPSEKHHWNSEPPYLCKECGAEGYVQMSVPKIIMAKYGDQALCKGGARGKNK